jgi:hypothetical protein
MFLQPTHTERQGKVRIIFLGIMAGLGLRVFSFYDPSWE